jgi:anti-sigma factor ChrR (cupin superfamily)
MNPDDEKLEERLRRIEPAEPGQELRGRILGRAREVRRQVQHRWLRRVGVAAALAITVAVGQWCERGEMAIYDEMLASRTPSRAESETKELAVALTDLLDGNMPRAEMERSLKIRMASRPSPGSLEGWRQTHQEPTF